MNAIYGRTKENFKCAKKNLADIVKIYTGSSGGLYFKGVILKVEILGCWDMQKI